MSGALRWKLLFWAEPHHRPLSAPLRLPGVVRISLSRKNPVVSSIIRMSYPFGHRQKSGGFLCLGRAVRLVFTRSNLMQLWSLIVTVLDSTFQLRRLWCRSLLARVGSLIEHSAPLSKVGIMPWFARVNLPAAAQCSTRLPFQSVAGEFHSCAFALKSPR